MIDKCTKVIMFLFFLRYGTPKTHLFMRIRQTDLSFELQHHLLQVCGVLREAVLVAPVQRALVAHERRQLQRALQHHRPRRRHHALAQRVVE